MRKWEKVRTLPKKKDYGIGERGLSVRGFVQQGFMLGRIPRPHEALLIICCL